MQWENNSITGVAQENKFNDSVRGLLDLKKDRSDSLSLSALHFDEGKM